VALGVSTPRPGPESCRARRRRQRVSLVSSVSLIVNQPLDDDTVAPHAIQFTAAAMDTDLLETEPFESAAARLPLCLPRYEDQVLVGFGLGNEEPSEYLEFENHNPTALILYKPIIRAFSRIGDKFNPPGSPCKSTRSPFLICSPDE
jgi:hypothetical protein